MMRGILLAFVLVSIVVRALRDLRELGRTLEDQ
jgi:hypothetical protein